MVLAGLFVEEYGGESGDEDERMNGEVIRKLWRKVERTSSVGS